MLRDHDPSLAPLLLAQRGVVSREHLAGAGVDVRLLDRRTASGRWTRFGPAVAVASTRPDLEQACAAALLHGGLGSSITGRAACLLHGLRDAPPLERVQVLLPHARRVVHSERVHVVRTRLAVPVQEVRGIPVVPPARALRDAAVGQSLRTVRAVGLAAVADGRVSADDLQAELGAGRLPGRAHLVRVVQDARLGAASAPEAEFHDLVAPLLRRLGLEVLLNPWLLVGGRVLCRPDAYLPALGRGFEIDSVQFHGDAPDLTRTLQRHGRAEDAGVVLRHVTPAQVRGTPRAVLGLVTAQVRLGGTPPAHVEVRRHDDPPPWVHPGGGRSGIP